MLVQLALLTSVVQSRMLRFIFESSIYDTDADTTAFTETRRDAKLNTGRCTSSTTTGLTEATEPTTNHTINARGSTPVLQTTVSSSTQQVITFIPGSTPPTTTTYRQRLGRRRIHVPKLGLNLARRSEDCKNGIMSIHVALPLFSEVAVRGVTYFKGYEGTNRRCVFTNYGYVMTCRRFPDSIWRGNGAYFVCNPISA